MRPIGTLLTNAYYESKICYVFYCISCYSTQYGSYFGGIHPTVFEEQLEGFFQNCFGCGVRVTGHPPAMEFMENGLWINPPQVRGE